MMKKLTRPAPGTPVSSSLICAIIDELESQRLVETPGVRLGRSPRGTRVFVEPPRCSRKPAKETPGCFEIRPSSGASGSDGGDSGSDRGGFDNAYFMIGGKIYDATSSAENWGFNRMLGVFVYVKVDLTSSTVEPTIETANNFLQLQTAAWDNRFAVIPLYKFGEEAGVVEIDFRKMPCEISGEFRT